MFIFEVIGIIIKTIFEGLNALSHNRLAQAVLILALIVIIGVPMLGLVGLVLSLL